MRSHRRLMMLAVVALAGCRAEGPAPVVASPRAPAPAPEPGPDPAVAAGVVADLGRLLALDVAGVALEQWPGREGATCTDVTLLGEPMGYSEMWCTECRVTAGRWAGSFRFFPDVVARTCTLQEVRAELEGFEPGWMDDVQAAIARGRGMPRRLDHVRTAEPGSFSWSSIRRWSNFDDDIYLYVTPMPPPKSPAMAYLLRRPPLLWLEAESPAFAEPPVGTTWDAVAAQACRDAGLSDCDGAVTDRMSGDGRVALAALEAALDLRDRLPPRAAQAGALAYWIDYVAGDGGRVASVEPAARERLALRGITYVAGYDSLVLEPTPLRDLAEHDPGSEWGQQAVLKLMCMHDGEQDDDPFRAVIARGEAFLKDHPGSVVERDVIIELASAHETWWSLSKADPVEEASEDLARWKTGAEAARQRAIQLYRRVRPGNERERAWLEQRLFRLEHGIDTGRRAHAPSKC